ncbi:MAG: protein-L-isoaspartate O-methyltransferase [Acetobacter sp.]|uniref:protein-L-isoaspartate O-methyltransferase family protein n=1 Tax=Acetobacter sp. TaxID=440 RepID=UPI0039ED079D
MTYAADQAPTSVMAPYFPDTRASAFDDARQRMVDDQVRPLEVNDPRIVTAMRALPREYAVPENEQEFAYSDLTLPLGNGRYLLQSMVTARLVQMAAIQAGQRVLVVGAATGYTAALIAMLGAEVTALEEDASLLAIGTAFTTLASVDVSWKQAHLTGGAPESSPFDLIFFDGAIEEIPRFCSTQLTENGRVAGILRPDDGTSSAFLAEAEKGEGWSIRRFFDSEAPVLPAFTRPAAFAF